jgi:hypothetical protein
MLAQLYKDPTILLEHFQRPDSASLVAGLEHMVPLFFVLKLLSLVECGPVAVTGLALAQLQTTDDTTYSLIHRTSVAATLPVRSIAS